MKNNIFELWLKLLGHGHHVERMNNIQVQVDDLATQVHALAKDSADIRKSIDMFKADLQCTKSTLTVIEEKLHKKL